MNKGTLAGYGLGSGSNVYSASKSQYFEFNASGTWQKPNDCTLIYVQVIGGGGGGSAGSYSAFPGYYGGGGGAAGGVFVQNLIAAHVPNLVPVIVGAGGNGGIAGNFGTKGGASNFMGLPSLLANGVGNGGGGGGGGTDARTGGAVAYGVGLTGYLQYGSYTTGAAGTFGDGGSQTPLRQGLAPTSGGGGGGSSSTIGYTGGIGGGFINVYEATGAPAGTDGYSDPLLGFGLGGGGGSGIANGAGTRAGNGGFPGGGGGGGAGGYLVASPPGGKGGNGQVRIWCW